MPDNKKYPYVARCKDCIKRKKTEYYCTTFQIACVAIVTCIGRVVPQKEKANDK